MISLYPDAPTMHSMHIKCNFNNGKVNLFFVKQFNRDLFCQSWQRRCNTFVKYPSLVNFCHSEYYQTLKLMLLISLMFAQPWCGMVLHLFQFPRSQTRLALVSQIRNWRMRGKGCTFRVRLLITRFVPLLLIFTKIHWTFHLLEESRNTPTSTRVSFLLSQ